jgi:hypothetical protein
MIDLLILLVVILSKSVDFFDGLKVPVYFDHQEI